MQKKYCSQRNLNIITKPKLAPSPKMNIKKKKKKEKVLMITKLI